MTLFVEKKKLLLIISFFAVVFIGIIALTAMGVLQLDHVPYQFPVTPGSPEWAEFSSKPQMLKVCQVPERKLNRMTTKALLETVLNYPLIRSYGAFNTIEVACSTMSDDFNGFDELFSRPDVTKALLNKYKNTKMLTIEEVEAYTSLEAPTDEQSLEFFTVFSNASIIEYLLQCNIIKNGSMSPKDFAILSELAAQKNEERRVAGIYSENSMYYP